MKENNNFRKLILSLSIYLFFVFVINIINIIKNINESELH